MRQAIAPVKKKAAEEYAQCKIILGKAAQKSGQTLWEMEQYLVCSGYKSQYSLEDLKKETDLIEKQK